MATLVGRFRLSGFGFRGFSFRRGRCDGFDQAHFADCHGVGGQLVAERVVDDLLNIVDVAIGGVDHETPAFRLGAHLHVADGQVFQLFERLADSGYFLRLVFFEDHLDGDAAGEVDVQQSGAAGEDARHASHDHDNRRDGRHVSHAKEIDAGPAEQSHHFDACDPSAAFGDVEHDARAEDGRKHTQHDAQPQHDGKAFDLVASDNVQHGGGDQRGQVGVDDGGRSAGEPVADGHPQSGAPIEFLTDTLEDQHVGVDGHTDGQHQTGQPWQGKRGLDGNHHGQNQQEVQHQGPAGHNARKTVVEQHEHQYQRDGHENGDPALVDRILAERGAGRHLADRLFGQGRRQAAGVEHADQVAGFFVGKRAGDFTPRGDRAIDARGRIEVSVEDNSQLAFAILRVWQVVAGQPAEQFPAHGVEHEGHAGLASLIHVGLGSDQVRTGDVERVLNNEEFRHLAAAAFDRAFGGICITEQPANTFLILRGVSLLDLDPAPQDVAFDVANNFAAFVLCLLDQGLVLETIGQHAEFERSGPADHFLDSPGFVGIYLGNDDLDLLDAVLADRNFLHAAGVHSPADGGDQLAHFLRAERLARFLLLLLVDFIDQDGATLQIDSQLRRPAGHDNHRPDCQAPKH